jgi:biotin carboxylase
VLVMKRLMLLGVGEMGRPYVRAAAAAGVAVCPVEAPSWVGDGDLGAVGVHRIAAMAADHRDVDELWALGAYEAVAAGPPNGVLAFSEPHVLGAALVQDRLGLPGPSLHAAVLSRNKALQRACFASHGLPQPEFIVAADSVAGVEWAAARLPVVIKPLTASGSAGVELIGDTAQLRAVAARRTATGRVLFETVVDGPEYSWEGFVRDGRIIFGNFTAKETGCAPYFVEVAHRCGHRFADGRADALVAGVVHAMGMRTGIVHLEFRVGPRGPVVIEVAVRTPGDYLMDLLAITYGFDPYAVAVALALGLPVDLPLPERPVSYAAVWYPTCPPGDVVAVEGLDELQSHPAVIRTAIKVRPGDRVPAIVSSAHRIGCVVIAGRTEEQRDEALQTARDRLRVLTRRAGSISQPSP